MHDQPPKHKKPATPLEKLREEAETGQFASRLVKDFRFSFRYSLGSERGHELILNLLGFQYFQGGEIVQRAVNEELPLIEEPEWRAAATPPKEHKTLKQDHFVRESEHEWNKFQTIVAPDRIAQLVEGMRNGEIDHYGDIVLQLAHHMIKKDQKYMTRGYGIKSGRPERSSPKKDMRASLGSMFLRVIVRITHF